MAEIKVKPKGTIKKLEKEIGWIRENTLKKAVTITEETQQTEQQEVPSQEDSKQKQKRPRKKISKQKQLTTKLR